MLTVSTKPANLRERAPLLCSRNRRPAEAPPGLIKNSITHLERLITWPEYLSRSSTSFTATAAWMPCVVFHKPSSCRLSAPPCYVKLVRVGPVRQVWAGPCTGEVGWVEEGRGREEDGKARQGSLYRSCRQSGRRRGKTWCGDQTLPETPIRPWRFSLFLPSCYVSAIKWWVKCATVLVLTFAGVLLVFQPSECI